jgi:cell division ATPase FtsA
MHAAAAMADDVVVLDAEAVLEAINEADRLAELAGGVSLDARGKRLVRGQVKAELKANLTDDILVAAYQQHGSLDKAAAALSKQTETEISRDKVWRAVQRAQEAGVLARTEDSGSVSRSVASHRRDRGKKLDQYRK